MANQTVTNSEVKKILVLYTGGTIGMTKDDEVYKPKKGAILERIKEDINLRTKILEEDRVRIKLLDQDIEYKIIEYDNLLDSSNMSVGDWKQIARDIEKYYNDYKAFVVLHGTDTLAYTSSALAFMLEGLKKTVIITGSQIPLFENRSDAHENFLSSLIFAGCYDIGEVCVCFGHKLFRGCRTVKYSSNKFRAFQSPNYYELGKNELKLKVFDQFLLDKRGQDGNFSVFTDMNEHITIIYFHPMITLEHIRQLLAPPTEGAVLLSYGQGNISTKKEILDVLTEATARKVLIVNISQCYQGTVDVKYETGKALEERGIIGGFDMSLQAAYTKLSYVMGHKELSLDQKKSMMQEDLRGEMTREKNDLEEHNG